MRYQKFTPSAELTSFVECYYIWEGETKERLEVQSPPNGFSAIVFNYGSPSWAYQHSPQLIAVPKAFASGQFTSNYHLVLDGVINTIGIVFKPSSLHNFFGLRMSELVNNRMPLELLLNNKAELLYNAIKDEGREAERIKIIDEFLLPYLPVTKSRLSVIDEAVEYIDLTKGNSSVERVASHLKISRRYLEKKFLEKVGVSPKFYARVKRFSILSNKLAHSKKVDWQDVVFESGFHDQSHLVKDFMEFNGMNPSEYHQQHRELVRFVKKQEPES